MAEGRGLCRLLDAARTVVAVRARAIPPSRRRIVQCTLHRHHEPQARAAIGDPAEVREFDLVRARRPLSVFFYDTIIPKLAYDAATTTTRTMTTLERVIPFAPRELGRKWEGFRNKYSVIIRAQLLELLLESISSLSIYSHTQAIRTCINRRRYT